MIDISQQSPDGLSFDELTHTYQFDNVEVPGVTRVLDQLVDFSMVNADDLERKRLIGTAVHQATALDDLSMLDESSVDPVIVPYVTAWRRFITDSGFIPEAIERRVYHSVRGYAGTLDRVGFFDRHVTGPRNLLDIKCSAAMPPTAGPQTAAYAEAYRMQYPDRRVDRRYVVLLNEAGQYRLIPCRDETDFTIFSSCLNLYFWRNKNGSNRTH